MAYPREALTFFFWFGSLENDVEKCKIKSSVYEVIGHCVRLRRLLMNNRKIVGLEKKQWSSTTATIAQPIIHLQMKE